MLVWANSTVTATGPGRINLINEKDVERKNLITKFRILDIEKLGSILSCY